MRGAVSVAILFHTMGNIMGAAVPHWTTDLGRWIGFAGLVVIAAETCRQIGGHLFVSISGQEEHEGTQTDTIFMSVRVGLASIQSARRVRAEVAGGEVANDQSRAEET